MPEKSCLKVKKLVGTCAKLFIPTNAIVIKSNSFFIISRFKNFIQKSIKQFCEGIFIQVLEGSEKNVMDVYASIKRDKRLIATKLVTTGTVEQRYFKDWDMAFDQISLNTINELEKCTHPNVSEYLSNAPAIKLLKLFTF